MCGRFASTSSPEEVAQHFSAALEPEVPTEPRFNVAPGTDITAVLDRGDGRVVSTLRWGLVPRWADDPRIGSRMINARAEKVPTSGAYKHAFARRRCIIPADGFYEWQKVADDNKRQPYYVSRPDGEPYALAGLWDLWNPPEGGEPLASCTIITCEPNEALAAIHDRMPVILPPEAWDSWLDAHVALDNSGDLLRPAPPVITQPRAISGAVNSTSNDGPELLEPLR